MPERDFAGCGVLVTGGTRGLGRAVVIEAARRGAAVAFCGRAGSTDLVERVNAETEARGGRAFYLPADVSKEDDVERFFDAALEFLPHLDVVINNAGIRKDRLLIDTTLEEWNQVLGVNLQGTFLVCRRAVEEFLAAGRAGVIVNVSSIATDGSVGQTSYAASKSAVISLTRSIAKEYGKKGIRCTAVVPGYLDSDMTADLDPATRRAVERISPFGRFGRVEEVAEAILFLASAESSFVNGDALYVTGALRDVPNLRH